MKTLLLFIGIIASITTKAQVTTVSLQASGLTCSMCSNAINKALKTLDFVSTVDADLKTSTFEISFKPSRAINFEMLKRKVERAGFSVCDFIINIHFDNILIKYGQPLIIQNQPFLFVNAKDNLLNGTKKIKILDKGFVSTKEYKVNSMFISSPQAYHAIAL